MEKAFLSIDETAAMLSLHPRTIHRYLKSGILKGAKIGGEWRISRSELNALLSNPEVVSELGSTWNKGVEEYIAGNPEPPEQGYRICTVVDCRFAGPDEAQCVSSALLKVVNQRKNGQGEARFQYTYDNSTGKARFILWGAPDYIIQMLSVLPTCPQEEK